MTTRIYLTTVAVIVALMIVGFNTLANCGDTLWNPTKTPHTYIMDSMQEPYEITAVIRYGDLNFKAYTLKVYWHYKRPDGKYQVVPVYGRPFTCDNVDPLAERK